ncbi:hypothetical protein NPIL_361751 [Nephila pilipes]|uniref:Uncharacterized protein n=1 Tax=Nephila pilipes TaxID=299642 RepID=A0A8X6QDA8_NEPPI|nr:hypothetical protein NPIL_361751 [Nephila pilipes]
MMLWGEGLILFLSSKMLDINVSSPPDGVRADELSHETHICEKRPSAPEQHQSRDPKNLRNRRQWHHIKLSFPPAINARRSGGTSQSYPDEQRQET